MAPFGKGLVENLSLFSGYDRVLICALQRGASFCGQSVWEQELQNVRERKQKVTYVLYSISILSPYLWY